MADRHSMDKTLEEFKREYFYRYSQAEENRQRENQAAIRIQSWFRGCRVRAYLRHLHKKAVIIEKIWRGFAARACFRQMVKAAYFTMKMNFYNEMAVRIQRRWRGFYIRKYIHNFYARKHYLNQVLIRNELVRKDIDDMKELERRQQERLEMENFQKAKINEAFRLHHLMSTSQHPGVFNSPFRSSPHEMELLLRQVRFRAPTNMLHKGACLKPILPPITSKKKKGTQGGQMRRQII